MIQARQLPLFLAMFVAAPLAAEVSNVNLTNAGAESDVSLVGITGDGRGAVVLSVSGGAGALAVYPFDGGAALPLGNEAEVPASDLLQPVLSPDGGWVVYNENLGTKEAVAAASVASGTAHLVSPEMFDGSLMRFAISPDGERVVYAAAKDPVFNPVARLYSAPLAGGTEVDLTGSLGGSNAASTEFAISPDGERVVFTIRSGTIRNIYSVPISGGTRVKLNASLSDGARYVSFDAISPDGGRVLYHSYDFNLQISLENVIFNYYTVPTLGGAAVAVTSAGAESAQFRGGRFVQGGARVLFQSSPGSEPDPAEWLLWSAPASGGTPAALTPQFEAGDHVDAVFACEDTSTILYRYHIESSSEDRLYRVGADGSGFGDVTPSGASTLPGVPGFVPECTEAFFAMEDTAGPIHALPLPAGAASPLDPQLAAGLVIDASTPPRLTPDGENLVFRVRDTGTNAHTLHWMPAGGGASERLSVAAPDGAGAESGWLHSSDGRWLVYRAQPSASGVADIFAARIREQSILPDPDAWSVY
ncbi:MAG: hypothetical protein PWP23_2638 [Candidatus Sumerlaeota bacterium]|nr:hypothetical protein [Candidatus Sumerlaeota bacterium]